MKHFSWIIWNTFLFPLGFIYALVKHGEAWQYITSRQQDQFMSLAAVYRPDRIKVIQAVLPWQFAGTVTGFVLAGLLLCVGFMPFFGISAQGPGIVLFSLLAVCVNGLCRFAGGLIANLKLSQQQKAGEIPLQASDAASPLQFTFYGHSCSAKDSKKFSNPPPIDSHVFWHYGVFSLCLSTMLFLGGWGLLSISDGFGLAHYLSGLLLFAHPIAMACIGTMFAGLAILFFLPRYTPPNLAIEAQVAAGKILKIFKVAEINESQGETLFSEKAIPELRILGKFLDPENHWTPGLVGYAEGSVNDQKEVDEKEGSQAQQDFENFPKFYPKDISTSDDAAKIRVICEKILTYEVDPDYRPPYLSRNNLTLLRVTGLGMMGASGASIAFILLGIVPAAWIFPALMVSGLFGLAALMTVRYELNFLPKAPYLEWSILFRMLLGLAAPFLMVLSQYYSLGVVLILAAALMSLALLVCRSGLFSSLETEQFPEERARLRKNKAHFIGYKFFRPLFLVLKIALIPVGLFVSYFSAMVLLQLKGGWFGVDSVGFVQNFLNIFQLNAQLGTLIVSYLSIFAWAASIFIVFMLFRQVLAQIKPENKKYQAAYSIFAYLLTLGTTLGLLAAIWLQSAAFGLQTGLFPIFVPLLFIFSWFSADIQFKWFKIPAFSSNKDKIKQHLKKEVIALLALAIFLGACLFLVAMIMPDFPVILASIFVSASIGMVMGCRFYISLKKAYDGKEWEEFKEVKAARPNAIVASLKRWRPFTRSGINNEALELNDGESPLLKSSQSRGGYGAIEEKRASSFRFKVISPDPTTQHWVVPTEFTEIEYPENSTDKLMLTRLESLTLGSSVTRKVLDMNDEGVQDFYTMALNKGHTNTLFGILNCCIDHLKGGSDQKEEEQIFDSRLEVLLSRQNANGDTIRTLYPDFHVRCGIKTVVIQRETIEESKWNIEDPEKWVSYEKYLNSKKHSLALDLLSKCAKKKRVLDGPPIEMLDQKNSGVQKFYIRALKDKSHKAVLLKILECCVNQERQNKGWLNVNVYPEDMQEILSLKDETGKDIHQLIRENNVGKVPNAQGYATLEIILKMVGITVRPKLEASIEQKAVSHEKPLAALDPNDETTWQPYCLALTNYKKALGIIEQYAKKESKEADPGVASALSSPIVLNQNDPIVQMFYKKALGEGEKVHWKVLMKILEYCVNHEKMQKNRVVSEEDMKVLFGLDNEQGQNIRARIDTCNEGVDVNTPQYITLAAIFKQVGVQCLEEESKISDRPVSLGSTVSSSNAFFDPLVPKEISGVQKPADSVFASTITLFGENAANDAVAASKLKPVSTSVEPLAAETLPKALGSAEG